MSELTQILERAGDGDRNANESLARIVYEELREMARREMRVERGNHTLQPTALVHEAYLRLLGGEGATFENRAHFFSAAAAAIRRVLVEHARKRSRQKRGGDLVRVEIDSATAVTPVRDDRLIQLDEALERLAEVDPEKARLVELRFFAGMTVEEVARMRSVSESTIAREWRAARAWLQGQLDEGSSDAD